MSTKIGSIHYDLDLKKDKFDANSNSASSSLVELGKKFAKFSAITIAGATAAGFAIKKTLVDPAISLNESLNAVQKTFGNASNKIVEFAKIADKQAGLSKAAFQEATVPIGAMLKNMGLAVDETADQTIKLTQRAADLSSVFNKDLSVSLTALQSGLRGESEPLKQFGVDLSQTTVKAYALNNGLIKQGEELKGTALATARLGAFYEQTNDFAGDFVDTSDQAANKTRIQQARFENLRAEIGTKLIPVYDRLLEVAEKVLDSIAGNTDKVDGFLAGMGNLINIIKKVILFAWELKDIFIALGVAFGVNLIITKVAAALVSLKTAFSNLITLLATNPLALAITAIATAFVLLNQMINSSVEAMERQYASAEKAANQAAEHAANQYQDAYNAWAMVNDIAGQYVSTLKQLRSAEERVKTAQEELTKVVRLYGAESQQALDATAELKDAQAQLKNVELQRANALDDLREQVLKMTESTGALKNITIEEIDTTIANIDAMRASMRARGEDTSSVDRLYESIVRVRQIKDTTITTNANTAQARNELEAVRQKVFQVPTSRGIYVGADVGGAIGALNQMHQKINSIPRAINIFANVNSNWRAPMKLPGMADGGFTGVGGKHQIAGVVHRGEYVIPKEGVDQRTGLPKSMGGNNTTNFNGNININSTDEAMDIMRILSRNQQLAVEGL